MAWHRDRHSNRVNGILLEILRLGVRYAQKSVGDRIKKSHPIWKNTTPDVA